MRIAFATSDGLHVDEQFRRATRLAVYEVGPGGARLERVVAFEPDRTIRTEGRIDAIRDAAVVFGTAFSPSSAVRVAARGIRPATAPPGTRITDLLARLDLPEGGPDRRGTD